MAYTPKTQPKDPSAQGKTSLPRETYLKLIAFFRDNPEPDYATFVAAGEACSVDPRTAKRAFVQGWPKRVPPMPPIRNTLHAESEEARAQRVRVFREMRRAEALKQADAAEDAVKTRTQEGLMVQATRGVAGKALGQALRLAQACEALTESVAQQLQDEFIGKNQYGTEKKSVEEKMAVLKGVSDFTKEASKLATVAMELERKFMGQPEKIIGIEDKNVSEQVNELMRELEELKALGGAEGMIDPQALLLKAAGEKLDIEAELAQMRREKDQSQ